MNVRVFCPLLLHAFVAYNFIHLNNEQFLLAALRTALNKATRTTHMKNLGIYRESLKNTKALFYLFLDQQPFTILSISCTMETLIVTLSLYLIFYLGSAFAFHVLSQCSSLGDKSKRNLFQFSYSVLKDTFQLTYRSCQKGNQGLRLAFFSKIWKTSKFMGIFFYLSLIKVSLQYFLIDGLSTWDSFKVYL